MSSLITAIAISAVGAGYSAYSQYQQGKAQQGLNNYNAALQDQNAMVAARDAGVLANSQRHQNMRLMARQRAGFAANGIVGETGSPLMVEAQQAGYLEMGALETERTGNINAMRYTQEALLSRAAGSIAYASGKMNAGATALQGAGQAAGSYANYKVLTKYNGIG